MILSDGDLNTAILHGAIGIEPFDLQRLQPASYDLTLGNAFKHYLSLDNRYIRTQSGTYLAPEIDPREDQSPQMGGYTVKDGECYYLKPKGFALGSTIETVRLPSHYQGKLDGKSSLARIGLLVHITGGFIDPGFQGEITLEFFNATEQTIRLWPGMKIAQISFNKMTSHAVRPYGTRELGSKYQGQTGPTISSIHENFEETRHGIDTERVGASPLGGGADV